MQTKDKETPMKEAYTAVMKQRGQWWIGWIEEVPGVNCQEASKAELMESLKITLREALEFNRQEEPEVGIKERYIWMRP